MNENLSEKLAYLYKELKRIDKSYGEKLLVSALGNDYKILITKDELRSIIAKRINDLLKQINANNS